MDAVTILLADLTQYGGNLKETLVRRYRVHVLEPTESVESAVAITKPIVACFDYDYPDARSLTLLTETRRCCSQVPVIMCTEHHSESLAIWALRSRVWDYFVKPVDPEKVLACIAKLHRLRSGNEQSPRRLVLPPPSIPVEARFHNRLPQEERATLPAIAYVKRNLHQRIREEHVAELCHMTRCQFSRAFRQTHGVTFQEFMIKHRVKEATRLLRNRHASITDICWTVGFRDASYFSRVFRRYTGQTPSEFRRQWLERRLEAIAPNNE